MKLVNQRYRVLGDHACTQTFAVRPGQRLVEALKHVLKTKGAGVLLQLHPARLHMGGGVQAQCNSGVGQRVECGEQVGKGLKIVRQGDGWGTRFAHLQQALGGQTPLGGIGQVQHAAVSAAGPRGQSGEPSVVVARRQRSPLPVTGFGRGLGIQPVLHGLRARRPADFQGSDGAALRLHMLLHAIGQRARATAGRQGLLGQLLHVAHQGIDIAPHVQHGIQRFAAQRVALLAPVVLCGFSVDGVLIGAEFFVKQAAAVKRVFAQHALAPSVDGVHRRVVHAFGRHRQTPSSAAALGAFGVGGEQVGQKLVLRRHCNLATKALRRFYQAGTDAVRQFARGSAGERHHQNVSGAQRLRKAVIAAVAQHQAQVQRGNRPRFAGAGTGFNQATAPERKVDGVQGSAFHWGGMCHADTPSTLSMAKPCGVAFTWVLAHSASGPQMECASPSKRPSSVSASKSG